MEPECSLLHTQAPGTCVYHQPDQSRPAFPSRVLKIHFNTGLSKKMDGIWNRYNLKSTGLIYTFGVLKCSEEFKVLDLP